MLRIPGGFVQFCKHNWRIPTHGFKNSHKNRRLVLSMLPSGKLSCPASLLLALGGRADRGCLFQGDTTATDSRDVSPSQVT